MSSTKLVVAFPFGKHRTRKDASSKLLLDDGLFEVILPGELKEEREDESKENITIVTPEDCVDNIEMITPIDVFGQDDEEPGRKRRRKQKVPAKTRRKHENSVNSADELNNTSYQSNEIMLTPTNNRDKLDAINQLCEMERTTNSSPLNSRPDGSPKKKEKTLFTCPICDKIFSYKWNLQLHAAVHSDEKRYVCAICTKSFKLKGQLDTHMKVHQDHYDYHCEVCGKEFKLKANLKTHIKGKHLDERLHQCSQCELTFKLKQHLLTHTRLKHS